MKLPCPHTRGSGDRTACEPCVEAAVREARAEERERCARVAEEYSCPRHDICDGPHHIAVAIRALPADPAPPPSAPVVTEECTCDLEAWGCEKHQKPGYEVSSTSTPARTASALGAEEPVPIKRPQAGYFGAAVLGAPPTDKACTDCFPGRPGQRLEDHDGRAGFGLCPTCNGTGRAPGQEGR